MKRVLLAPWRAYVGFCERSWVSLAIVAVGMFLWFGGRNASVGSQLGDFIMGFCWALIFFGAVYGAGASMKKRKAQGDKP